MKIEYCKNCKYLFHFHEEITEDLTILCEHYECRKNAPHGLFPYYPIIRNIENEFCGAFESKAGGFRFNGRFFHPIDKRAVFRGFCDFTV